MRRLVAAFALLVCLAVAAPAAAAPNAVIGLEDERLLLSDPGSAPAAVATWKQMGVDVVRLHARWQHLANAQRGGPYHWGELDRAVDIVRAAGLGIVLTVTGPGPAWTSRKPSKRDPRWEPDPALFGRFARDVATRYGHAVDRYTIWNEPNIGGWLMPQWDCRRKRCTLAAPHVYRGLVRAAFPAIRAVDPTAEILIGELAPIGLSRATRSNGRIAPLPFLRAMGCVDGRYKRLRVPRCARFKAARADSIGYHPHGVQRAPDRANPNRDEAQIGDLPRLTKVLDRLARSKRLVPARGRRFDIHLTEFGYQTSPPDHDQGITLAQQTLYLQQAAYIAWKHPRVRSLVHYQWYDEPVHYRGPGSAAYSGWQSGLLLVNGMPKPALAAFPSPFVIDIAGRSRTGRVWGQVRPGGAHVVTLLRRPRGAESFSAVADIPTDANGYFSRVMALDRSSEYRYAWRDPQPSPYVSDERLSGVIVPGAKSPRRLKAPSSP